MSDLAGDGRDSPLKYTNCSVTSVVVAAGDGRDSPLKYTTISRWPLRKLLGMAGIHRSSTLVVPLTWARIVLGMAGIHRSSTL